MTAPAWFAEAACRGQGPDPWFPVEDSRRTPSVEAKRICASCPVTSECLTYAQELHILDGIWGGQRPATVKRAEQKTNARARRALRTNLAPRFAKAVESHGTRAGYIAGCRCLDCTDANRDYDRSRPPRSHR